MKPCYDAHLNFIFLKLCCILSSIVHTLILPGYLISITFYPPNNWGAAIAQWIRLRLPSCRPGFESQAHHLRFLQSKFVLYCHCVGKRTKINKKRGRVWPIFKKQLQCAVNYLLKYSLLWQAGLQEGEAFGPRNLVVESWSKIAF